MSLGQPNAQSVLTSNTPILHIQGTDLSVSDFMLDYANNATTITFMCWAQHIGAFVNTYHDLFGVSDHGDAYGMSLLRVSDTQAHLNLGDNLNDWTSVPLIENDVWHHYALTTRQVATRNAFAIAHLDGVAVIDSYNGGVGGSSDGLTYLVTPFMNNRTAPPGGPSFVSIVNTRASDTDGQACWVGNMAGVKIWSGRALTPDEIRREMWSYWPVHRKGLWAFSPLQTLDTRTRNYAGACGVDWTSRGAWFAEGTTDPPGLGSLHQWRNYRSIWPMPRQVSGPFPTMFPV